MAAEKKISELNTAGAISGSEYFEIVQDGENKRIALSAIGKLANDFQSENFLCTSAVPVLTALGAAGTTPTISIVGNNECGTITITTGTGCISGDLCRITLDTYAYPTSGVCVVSAANNNAAAKMNTVSTSGNPNTVTITLSAALTDATLYKFNYHIKGY
jgi:hypothetical protein